MVLTDQQIERYSRQIIVPKIGGNAQERLLKSRIVLLGDLAQIESPLAYLVGAGVGEIELAISDRPEQAEALCARMAELNADVAVRAGRGPDSRYELIFAFVASSASLDGAMTLLREDPRRAFVIARLDEPAQIGVFPSPPPCPKCSHRLFVPIGRRAAEVEFVAMLATTEAFKLLAHYPEHPEAAIVEFDGYASRSSAVRAAPGCICESHTAR